MTPKIPHFTQIHGHKLRDDYRWLQKKDDPQVLAHLRAENEHAEKWFSGTQELENRLYGEILSYINEDDEEVPVRQGSFWYGSRTKKGLQYPILFRRSEVHAVAEDAYLDLNRLAEGHPFFSLGDHEVSPNEKLLAFTTDTVGFRQYQLYVKDLESGTIHGPLAEKVGSVVWAANNQTLFYTIEDSAKRQYRVYRHEFGLSHASSPDVLVYEEKDERFSVFVSESLDRSVLFMGADSLTTTEIQFAWSQAPDQFQMIVPRKQDVEYSVAVHGDHIFMRINDRGDQFRVVKMPLRSPSLKKAIEVVPLNPAVAIESLEVFDTHLVLSERAEGQERLRVIPISGTTAPYVVEFPEPAYSVYPAQNRVYSAKTYRYRYSSFTSPQGTYELDFSTGKSTLLKEKAPPREYHREQYRSERIFAMALDGTLIPISLVYRKDLFKKGSNPLHLYGYGSYGHPLSAAFSASRFALIDRGFVMAIAHLRGGGEYGKPWHDHGKMKKKMNTFTDFIAVAEHLIQQGYSAKDQLVIEGGSAGGLLMGAVTNLRPDLFRVVLSQVPFVDVLNTMLDDTLPLTVGEYEEWGNPKKKADFIRMKAYSPYDNIAAKAYPTMLVRTSLHDSQVMYWEPAKYVAKLRELKTDQNPLLFLINMEAGHGGASGRYDAIRERARDWVFILQALGRSQSE
ncbi:MAG: hypothetical protein RJB38_1079 [Pseudomonadota bacterium]|jgi:oligopeptidase B